MKILVVGQGGREHAIAWKIAQSSRVTQVYCAPGNAGTAADVKNVDIGVTEIDRLAKFAIEKEIDLTVVGPEAPLVLGIVDEFRKRDLRIFGPTAAAAQLEGSKIFCKEILKGAGVPTADSTMFDDPDAAISYLNTRVSQRCVVKADGLAAGKGVFVCEDQSEAVFAVNTLLEGEEFGEAGSRILIEEMLEGQEISVFAITDGKAIVPLASSQDHKRAHDGDEGPNTGGMGAYSPTPFATDEILAEVFEKALVPTVHEMRRKKCSFTGVLYCGIMLTPQGPKVLEYNVRLGDPECQAILMRLDSDLAAMLYAAADGKLSTFPDLKWDPRPSVCVVMASEGYPASYEKGRPIRGLDQAAEVSDAKVFHAGTTEHGNNVVNDGGRVLGVTALGDTLDAAKQRAYEAVKPIRWDGAWCRKDISDKARGI